MAELEKLLGYLSMPTGLLWLFMLAAVAYTVRVRAYRSTAAWAVAFVLYSIAGNGWVGAALMRAVEGQIIAVHPDDVGTLDALFVLGGGSKLGPRDYPQVGSAGDRIIEPVRLYHAGKVKTLVTSGRTVPGMGDPQDITLEIHRIWRELGVPDEAIIRLSAPYNTRMEIEAYSKLIAERRFKQVGLLTSAYHLPRAMRTANRVGLAVVPIAVDHRGGGPAFSYVHLVPNGAGFKQVHLACWEIIGSLVGR